jgi:hypothetical protein
VDLIPARLEDYTEQLREQIEKLACPPDRQ